MVSIEEHIKQIDINGFTLIPNILSDSDCENYKQMLERDYEKYSPLYCDADAAYLTSLAHKGGEKVVYNLHNKSLAWYTLFEHDVVLSILDVFLRKGSYQSQEPYYLNNISARCPLIGHPGQQLHLDSNLPGVNYCIIANVIWLFDDFTIDNGATRVVPGSHKWQFYAPDNANHKDEVRIIGRRGSVLIFNANLWHGGGENTNGHSRWALLLGYARWFVKPSYDFMQNMPHDIYNQLTDKQKDLLGFRLVPPKDEFTRQRRRSDNFEVPFNYNLPR
ncbi:MAG: hypothetical protein K0R76_425 [Alphaproteobacteria bacterium]|jgi:ectoine hydroxylase-related dioxygenase (phytanoyl-CoA dioxygenase family)|nr:hypothetical protein [Alphaproteobacteria bacterium]